MNDDLPCAQDHFREALISLMGLAHSQMEPQEIVFTGVSVLSSYCYTMAPTSDIATKTLTVSIQQGKEDATDE